VINEWQTLNFDLSPKSNGRNRLLPIVSNNFIILNIQELQFKTCSYIVNNVTGASHQYYNK